MEQTKTCVVDCNRVAYRQYADQSKSKLADMDIREVVSNLAELPDEGTVFAEKINGTFRPESRAVIAEMTDEELKRPVADVALQRAPGTSYFLEVSIAREVIEGWKSNHSGTSPTTEQALESIIFYAENDAYPQTFLS